MKVSVFMVTYNHEKFIAQAIESVVCQETDFDWELVIGEDCSTDRTREIVTSYQARYPDRIRLLLPEQNIGVARNALNVLEACSGDYVAILEGDDYWTSPRKLRTQVRFLDQNPSAAGCFSDAAIVDDKGNVTKPSYLISYFGTKGKPRYTTADIVNSMGTSPANTLLMRRCVIDNLPEWFRRCPRHSGLDLLITLRGDLCYLDECLGAYRVHSTSTWTAKPLLYRLHSDLIYLKHLVNNDLLYRGYGDVFFTQIIDKINKMVTEIVTGSDLFVNTPEESSVSSPNPAAAVRLAALAQEILAAGKDELSRNNVRHALSLFNLARELDQDNREAALLSEQGAAIIQQAPPPRPGQGHKSQEPAQTAFSDNLTNVTYWDKDRPRDFVPWHVNSTIFSHILNRYLPVNPDFSCTEIGAYPGAFLCHMAKAYRYRPTAIEFSNYTDHIRELFTYNRVPDLRIINDDFLNVDNLQFDVVTSFGFVEHFTDYERIIAKHFELTKPGGYVVISVPRFDAFQGSMFETVYNEEAYRKMKAAHNMAITNLQELKRVISTHTDEILFADHVVGDLLYYNWNDKNVREDKKWLVYFINKIQPLVSNAIELDEFLSPYILTVSRKPLTGARTATDQRLQYLQAAASAISGNNVNEAINQLNSCIRQYPQHMDSYEILCDLYLSIGNGAGAVNAAFNALKTNGFSFDTTSSILNLLQSGGTHLLDELYLRTIVWEPEHREALSYIAKRGLTAARPNNRPGV